MAKQNITTEEFFKRVKEMHGDYYDYSQTVYYRTTQHINIVCKTHGLFAQLAGNHMRGAGCPKCALEKSSTERRCTGGRVYHKG